jgi:hypothetical protein
MAMVLKAFGYDVTPHSLNIWMKDKDNKGYYPGGDVRWYQTMITYDKGKSPIKTDEPRWIPPDGLDHMNNNLNDYPVFVQVKGGHWVLVTGKTKSGKYTILDPGHVNNVVLDPDKIAKYINVLRK